MKSSCDNDKTFLTDLVSVGDINMGPDKFFEISKNVGAFVPFDDDMKETWSRILTNKLNYSGEYFPVDMLSDYMREVCLDFLVTTEEEN